MNVDEIIKQMPVKKLEELGIGLVYLFGSCAEGVSGPLSDMDIGVVLENPRIVRGNTMPMYNALYGLFSEFFGTSNIDLVFLERASLELRFAAITHGKILFVARDDLRDDFEHRTAMLYADFKPALERFNRAVLSRS
jgi:predicted nucleotidyltransferase